MTEELKQGTDAWIKARLGRATASRIAHVVARTKSGYSSSRANYAAELIAERLTGVQTEQYVSRAMQEGTETEPEARAAYAFYADAAVEQVGFVPHPKIAMSGASPDGMVGKAGLVEIKCPLIATHLETVLGGSIPGNYIIQCQWQMACTGRKWTDWVSYNKRLPESMRLIVHRIKRDDVEIARLEKEVTAFLAEIDGTIDALKKRFGQFEVAA